MPVERSKPLKRSDSGNQFVWASQPEPTNDSCTDISFTHNMSSSFFADMPPLASPPGEFIMFPPTHDPSSPRKQPHSKKKPENHIPRPPNAFILFRSSFVKSQHVSTEVETNHSTLSKIIGLTWQNLPEEERQVWHLKAKEALDEHKRKFPKYAFRPVQTKSKGSASEKRKVREVEPKDIKRCTKIAQLLVEGKKGEELNAAIQEFDKHHVPEIVTRFETPITAHAFRRSSSAPIPETEASKKNQPFLQQIASSPRKPRPSSTQTSRCSSPIDILDQSYPSFSENLQSSPTLKEEHTAFSFDSFSFDNTTTAVANYDCDPLSPQATDSFSATCFSPQLSIDTSFMNDWVSSPLSLSPSTPHFMSTPSPIVASPSPSYASQFESYDGGFQKSFDDFSAQFSIFDPTCTQAQQANMCGNSIDLSLSGSDSMFAAFGNHAQHQDASALSHLDLDFSALMSSLPQYAI